MKAEERLCVGQEAGLLAQMKHPFIVRYIENISHNTHTLYLVMEYCEGGTQTCFMQFFLLHVNDVTLKL